MTIRNPEAFMAGVWDWGMLDSCFPGKMKVSDIDGFVERKGKFLVLETKQPGVPIPTGQKIMFESMQKSGLFTVVIVWGTKNKPEQMQVYYSSGHTSEKKAADINKFKQTVAWWYSEAEKTG